MISARCNPIHPLLVFKIPVDGLHNSNLKRGLRIPAEISFDLARVDTIATVMSKAVFHMFDEGLIYPIILQSVMQLFNDGLDDKNVGTFVVTANIIDFTDLATIGNHINCFAVILDI